MTNGAKTLIAWLTQNVLKTYQEPISTQATLPYIGLSYVENNFSETTLQQLTIWTRSDGSYKEAYEYADKLNDLIGEQGVLIGDDVKFYITKGSPFVQNRLDDTKTIKAVLVNLNVKLYT